MHYFYIFSWEKWNCELGKLRASGLQRWYVVCVGGVRPKISRILTLSEAPKLRNPSTHRKHSNCTCLIGYKSYSRQILLNMEGWVHFSHFTIQSQAQNYLTTWRSQVYWWSQKEVCLPWLYTRNHRTFVRLFVLALTHSAVTSGKNPHGGRQTISHLSHETAAPHQEQ